MRSCSRAETSLVLYTSNGTDDPSPPGKCTLALRAGFSAAFPASGVAMLGIIQIFLLVIVSQGSPCLEIGSVAAPASTGHSRAISSFTFRRRFSSLRSPWAQQVPSGEAGSNRGRRSEEHKSELQSLLRISYAVYGSTKKREPEY